MICAISASVVFLFFLILEIIDFFFFHAYYIMTGNLSHEFVKLYFFLDLKVKSAVSTL